MDDATTKRRQLRNGQICSDRLITSHRVPAIYEPNLVAFWAYANADTATPKLGIQYPRLDTVQTISKYLVWKAEKNGCGSTLKRG